jgi:GNAT superfamily N-acetyltransferase
MRTHIKIYDLTKVWPPTEALRFCYRNSFNSNRKSDGQPGHGLIVEQLKESLRFDRDYLIMAHDGVRWTGWGIAYKDEWNTKKFQVYVPPRNRRKGIASKILKRACNLMGRVEVYDIDTSNAFFKSNGLTKGEAITGRKLKIK